MNIDILICTIDDGVGSVGLVLMPPMPDVHYVVSVQHTRPLDSQPTWTSALDMLRTRPDVTVTTIEGRGLSRNRNNALRHATADIIVIADDDCRYSPRTFDTIRKAYAERPDADVVCFEAVGHDGQPLKAYPTAAMSYAEACRYGYSPASVELAIRRDSLERLGVRFDERFGLGSEFPASEEYALLHDIDKAGGRIHFVPQVIVATDAATTGQRFLDDARLQEAKGAVFRRCFGTRSALWRTLKEGAHHFVFNHVNPLPIWYNMLRGICNSR